MCVSVLRHGRYTASLFNANLQEEIQVEHMMPDVLDHLYSLTNEYRSVRYDLRNMQALAKGRTLSIRRHISNLGPPWPSAISG
jgi:hypothetical protein